MKLKPMREWPLPTFRPAFNREAMIDGERWITNGVLAIRGAVSRSRRIHSEPGLPALVKALSAIFPRQTRPVAQDAEAGVVWFDNGAGTWYEYYCLVIYRWERLEWFGSGPGHPIMARVENNLVAFVGSVDGTTPKQLKRFIKEAVR